MSAPVELPKVTSDRICCPVCRQRAPFTPRGLTDWHQDGAGRLCDAVFPSYVVARDPLKVERRPVTHSVGRWRLRGSGAYQ